MLKVSREGPGIGRVTHHHQHHLRHHHLTLLTPSVPQARSARPQSSRQYLRQGLQGAEELLLRQTAVCRVPVCPRQTMMWGQTQLEREGLRKVNPLVTKRCLRRARPGSAHGLCRANPKGLTYPDPGVSQLISQCPGGRSHFRALPGRAASQDLDCFTSDTSKCIAPTQTKDKRERCPPAPTPSDAVPGLP